MRHDLAGPLCQWAETAAAVGRGSGGAGEAGDLGGTLAEVCGTCSVRVVAFEIGEA